MKEKLKIIVDDENHTHIWINGKEIKHITKIKFEVSENNSNIPNLEIKKNFLPMEKVDFKKPKINMDGRDIIEYFP